MPDFLIDPIAKAGPFFQPLIAGMLWLLWRAIEGTRKAQEASAAAQVAQVAATNALADALKGMGGSVGEIARNENEVIRMMEKFQAAEGERHAMNVNTLNQVLAGLSALLRGHGHA